MNLEHMYAEAIAKAQSSGLSGEDLLKGLKAALARRGHTRLLPRIYKEFEKLELHKDRMEEYARVTPEREETRILIELYRSLISTWHCQLLFYLLRHTYMLCRSRL